MTELETRQPLPRKRVGPERAALVLAMAVVSGLAMIQQAPTRREMASGARAEACLLTAKVETTLVCVRAWLESQERRPNQRRTKVA